MFHGRAINGETKYVQVFQMISQTHTSQRLAECFRSFKTNANRKAPNGIIRDEFSALLERATKQIVLTKVTLNKSEKQSAN